MNKICILDWFREWHSANDRSWHREEATVLKIKCFARFFSSPNLCGSKTPDLKRHVPNYFFKFLLASILFTLLVLWNFFFVHYLFCRQICSDHRIQHTFGKTDFFNNKNWIIASFLYALSARNCMIILKNVYTIKRTKKITNPKSK